MSTAPQHMPGFHVLIPARLSSTRLPNKPLADLAGLPMVVRVAQRAALSHPLSCTVAADHPLIAAACTAAGVPVVLTGDHHLSGSDRLAEACALLGLGGDDIVVNVQGDEPLMDPDLVRAVAQLLAKRPDCAMATAAHPLEAAGDYHNPNVVKVVLDRRGTASYFSRAPLPWWRDAPEGGPALPTPTPLRHIGLYAYRAGFLRGFPDMEPSPHERTESLEQLRVLWHGERIAVHTTPNAPGPGVDTPDDLARVRALLTQTPA